MAGHLQRGAPAVWVPEQRVNNALSAGDVILNSGGADGLCDPNGKNGLLLALQIPHSMLGHCCS
ncbi:hypothetical protein OG801_00215 [Nocardioides sp. NBC_00163]|uniref:hypothetical protein n=1 Tax=Nocardioides sp. NBC_00163 TaxID=2975999 RepID=UPI00324A89A7